MSEPKSEDQFDAANLRLPEDFLAGNGKRKVRRYHNRPRYDRCVLPLTLLDAMVDHRANWTVLAVVVALHELWFTNPNHNNPVRFTTYNLRRFGLSRYQKYRALDFLEKIGQVSVKQMGSGKNPMVTLKWEAVRK